MNQNARWNSEIYDKISLRKIQSLDKFHNENYFVVAIILQIAIFIHITFHLP